MFTKFNNKQLVTLYMSLNTPRSAISEANSYLFEGTGKFTIAREILIETKTDLWVSCEDEVDNRGIDISSLSLTKDL